MNRILCHFIFGALLAGMLQGCYYDVESTLYAGNACDTTLTGFVAKIQPLVASNCQVCHSGASPDGNLSLETYEQIRTAALNGWIVDRISRNTGDVQLMPPNGPLSSCDIQAIDLWTQAGAPEN